MNNLGGCIPSMVAVILLGCLATKELWFWKKSMHKMWWEYGAADQCSHGDHLFISLISLF